MKRNDAKRARNNRQFKALLGYLGRWGDKIHENCARNALGLACKISDQESLYSSEDDPLRIIVTLIEASAGPPDLVRVIRALEARCGGNARNITRKMQYQNEQVEAKVKANGIEVDGQISKQISALLEKERRRRRGPASYDPFTKKQVNNVFLSLQKIKTKAGKDATQAVHQAIVPKREKSSHPEYGQAVEESLQKIHRAVVPKVEASPFEERVQAVKKEIVQKMHQAVVPKVEAPSDEKHLSRRLSDIASRYVMAPGKPWDGFLFPVYNKSFTTKIGDRLNFMVFLSDFRKVNFGTPNYRKISRHLIGQCWHVLLDENFAHLDFRTRAASHDEVC